MGAVLHREVATGSGEHYQPGRGLMKLSPPPPLSLGEVLPTRTWGNSKGSFGPLRGQHTQTEYQSEATCISTERTVKLLRKSLQNHLVLELAMQREIESQSSEQIPLDLEFVDSVHLMLEPIILWLWMVPNLPRLEPRQMPVRQRFDGSHPIGEDVHPQCP